MPQLTPEKKARLKKDVLEAIENAEVKPVVKKPVVKAATIAPVIKPAPLVVAKKEPVKIEKKILPKPEIKISAPKPIVKPAVKVMPEIRKPVAPVKKIAPARPVIKSVAKPVVKKPTLIRSNKVAYRPAPKINLPQVDWEREAAKEEIFFTSAKNAKVAKNKNHQSRFSAWFWWLMVVLAFAVLVLVVDVFGLYRFNWRDGFSYRVANVLHLPAGTVDGQFISLADYLSDLKLLENSIATGSAVSEDADGELVPATVNKVDATLKKEIFNRLASNLVVEGALKKYKKEVTTAEIDAQIKDIVDQIGEKEMAKSILQMYGLTIDQYREKVVRPLLVSEKLQQAIAQDDNLAMNQDAKKRADQLLEAAQKPEVDFKILANQYTEDQAGVDIGGDMGLINQGELAPEIEEVLFSKLKPGEVYGQAVKNATGYHILKLEQKLTDADTGKVSVRASQILIKVDVNEYIKSLVDQAKIVMWVK